MVVSAASPALVRILSIPWEIIVTILKGVLWQGQGHGMCCARKRSVARVIPVCRVPFLLQRTGSVCTSL
eukprot:10333931-Heterocapsa_arctica.AAC.1